MINTAQVKTSQKSIRKKAPIGEISVFCTQVSLLMKSGIPLYEGIETIADSTTQSGGELIREIANGVGITGSLYEAIRQMGVFPVYMVEMIHIGEAVGKLDDVLESLGEYYNREGKMRDSIRGAVLYPIILVLLMAAVIALLVYLVLPVFSDLFASLGNDITNNTINAGSSAGGIILKCMGVLLILILLAIITSLIPAGRAILMKISIKLPFFKKLYILMSASRFARVISMMLYSGYNIGEALELSENVVPDKNVKEKINLCRKQMEGGKPFSEALLDIGLFSGMFARLVQTGEKAGKLDDVMYRLAGQYNDDMEDAIASLIAVIEPLLVILLSVIIGAILLSIMLPLVQIMSLLG